VIANVVTVIANNSLAQCLLTCAQQPLGGFANALPQRLATNAQRLENSPISIRADGDGVSNKGR
jgi:hypothetical protein